MMVFTIVISIGSLFGSRNGEEFLTLIWFALAPLAVAIPLVLGASLLIGLPLTAVAKRMSWESASTYVLTGAVAGFLLPIILLLLMGASAGYWTALLGAFGGGVTGWTWWVSAREPHVGQP